MSALRPTLAVIGAGVGASLALLILRRRFARRRVFHLVATDMDGTFLAPADGIETIASTAGTVGAMLSERSIAVAHALQKSGIIFCIATGRPVPALQPHINTLGLEDLPCICFNGAAVCKLSAGGQAVCLKEQSLDPAAVRKILNFADEAGLCVSYSLFDRALARCSGAEQAALLKEYEALEGVRQTVVASTKDLLALPPPLKIVLLTRSPEDGAARARAAVGDGVHVIAAEMHVEFLSPGVDKGTALAWLCEHLSVPLSATVAFGDSFNDIEMLRASGLGVAMRNARDAAKAAADHTLPWSNIEDGVARQCELMQQGSAQGLLCAP